MCKRFIGLFLFSSVLFFTGCKPEKDTRNLTFFVEKYEQAGMQTSNIETPPYNMLNAEGAVQFQVEGNTVTIYEFENKKAAQKAAKTSPDLEGALVNGRFTVESNDGEMMEFFTSIY